MSVHAWGLLVSSYSLIRTWVFTVAYVGGDLLEAVERERGRADGAGGSGREVGHDDVVV